MVVTKNSSRVGFATTTDQPSVVAAFKTNNSGESEKFSVGTNVLCSDFDEHIVCDSQDCAGAIKKMKIPVMLVVPFVSVLAISHLIV